MDLSCSSHRDGQFKTVANDSAVLLLSATQMESTLCFLDGILQNSSFEKKIYKMTLGTGVGVYRDAYPVTIIEEVITFIQTNNVSFVLVSLSEFSLRRAIGLLREIKSGTENVVVIAGGPFAIEYPDECIRCEYVDIVNYTHGLFLPRVLEEYPSLGDVPNILFKTEAGIVRNRPENLDFQMDEMPLPNWRIDNEIMLYNEAWHSAKGKDAPRLVWLGNSGGALPVEHHQVPAKHTGVLIVSAGCPISTCDFCSISRMYNKNVELLQSAEGCNKKSLRRVSWYSPENIIKVVKQFLEARPKTEYILFNDNDFASMPIAHIPEFCTRYKEEIGLPFYCQSSPHWTVARGEEFIRQLVDAGLDTYCIGAESGEDVNEEIYNRKGGDKVVHDAMGILNKFASVGKIFVAIDFINGNAAETNENIISSINLIKSIPLPWDMAIHNLTLNSKSDLAQIIFEKHSAKVEGALEMDSSDYHHAQYENFGPLKEPYLNIILEWLGGRHDDENIGRLKRDVGECMKLPAFVAAIQNFPGFAKIVNAKLSLFENSFDFFLDADVREYFSENTDMLQFVFNNLRVAEYGYHRKNRYEYDWGDVFK